MFIFAALRTASARLRSQFVPAVVAIIIAVPFASAPARGNVVIEYQGNPLSATDDKFPAEPGVTAIHARIELGIDALPKGTNTLYGGNFRQPIGWMVSAEISDGVNTYKWSPKGPEYWDISLKTDASGALISWTIKAWTESGDQTHASLSSTHYSLFKCPKLDQSYATVFVKHVPHGYNASTCNLGTIKVTDLGSATVTAPPAMPALKALGVAEVQNLKAQGGGIATSIKFTNRTNSTVSILWIDYSGQQKPYGSIKPSESLVQSTYTLHPWLVSDVSTGKPIAGFLPETQAAEAIIGGSAPPIGAAAPSNVASPPAVSMAQINSLVDDVFIQWSETWTVDHYLRGSAHAKEVRVKDDSTYVRGTFQFSRVSGPSTTITFSSVMKRSSSSSTGFSIQSVCYNDSTTHMTDCSNSGLSERTQQMMGVIVAAGLMSALGDGSLTSSPSPSSTGPSCATVGEYQMGKQNCYAYPVDRDGVLQPYGYEQPHDW
jgi:hypothetical protein